MTVYGNNFATNMEVVVGQWNNGTWQELKRYSGSSVTGGTQQNHQTLGIQVTEQNVISALNQQSTSIQVVDDGGEGKETLSEQNNDTVKAACQKEIEAAATRKKDL